MVWYTHISTPEEGKQRDLATFYENTAASKFLNDTDGQEFFVCGLKGIGKTLLLRHKSAAERRTLPGVRFVPKFELAETLTSNLSALNENQMSRLSSWTAWQAIWRTVLTVVVAKCAGVYIPPSLAAMFPDTNESISVLAHLNAVLSTNVLGFLNHEAPKADAQINALLGDVRSGVHVYVDAIDELVLLHSGKPLQEYESGQFQKGHLAENVWVSAQTGFAKAAMDIHRNNRHVRIYGAFRYEAFERYDSSDKQNLEPHVLHIQYTHEELGRIFLGKLERLEEINLQVFAKKKGDIVTRFLGFNTLAHPSVRKPNRSPFRESVIDYLIRHTRGRPRELDEIGRGLQALSIPDRTDARVRERVRIRSREFFAWAKSEAIPYWRAGNDELLKVLESNWISRREKEHLEKKYGSSAFEDLFLNGLMGCTVHRLGSRKMQLRFRQFDPSAPVDIKDFKNADYFGIHPCVNLATYSEKTVVYEPDPWNVSGHGQAFIEARDKGHVHIGAGALGLGCVVPSLAAETGVGICVLQRVGNPKWEELASSSGEQLFLRIRKLNADRSEDMQKPAIRFTVVRPNVGAEDFDHYVDDWARGERNIFMLAPFDDKKVIPKMLSLASSVSTAVRGKNLSQIAPLLNRHVLTGTHIYPFENDEAGIEEFKKAVEKSGCNVVDVCVDRICLSPITSVKEKSICTSVEAFSHIVILDKTNFSTRLFCPVESENIGIVTIVSDAREFEFRRLRKRILVNGIHFFLGLASRHYLSHQIAPHEPSVADALADAPASQLLVRTQEIQSALTLANQIFSLGLLIKAEEDGLIDNVEQLCRLEWDLDEQQATFQDRLQTMPDQLSRILNPTDENYLEKARAFMRGMPHLPDKVRKSPLLRGRYKNANFEQLRKNIDTLRLLFLDELLKGK